MMNIDVFSFLFFFFLILSSGGDLDEYAISDDSIHVRFFRIYFLYLERTVSYVLLQKFRNIRYYYNRYSDYTLL